MNSLPISREEVKDWATALWGKIARNQTLMPDEVDMWKEITRREPAIRYEVLREWALRERTVTQQ